MGLTTHGQNTNAAARFNLFIFDFQTHRNLHSANAVKGIEMHKERLQIYLAKWKSPIFTNWEHGQQSSCSLATFYVTTVPLLPRES